MWTRSLRILATTVYHSTPMLMQLAIIQLSLALCFAVMTFFFERDNSKGHFQTMVDSLWFAVITMYTIGYGDQVCKKKCVTSTTRSGTRNISGSLCWYNMCHSWSAWYGVFAAYYRVRWDGQRGMYALTKFKEFNYLYNLDRDECKLRPEELMGDRTEEKTLRINRCSLSLTERWVTLFSDFIEV